MMNELFARGPITCSLATPEEFDYGGCWVGWVGQQPRMVGCGGWRRGRWAGCQPGCGAVCLLTADADTAGLCAWPVCPCPCPAGYHRGVAIDTTNATDVDHDVEVVGWGEQEDGLK
jgi:hypothetical protein